MKTPMVFLSVPIQVSSSQTVLMSVDFPDPRVPEMPIEPLPSWSITAFKSAKASVEILCFGAGICVSPAVLVVSNSSRYR